jgi:hypothetical protein
MFKMTSKFSLIPAAGALFFAGLSFFDAVAPNEFQFNGAALTPQSVGGADRTLPAEHTPLPFPPVFGLRTDDAPTIHTRTEAAPTKLDVRLAGVLVSGETRWAVLDASEGSLVLREGDLFADGAKIARVASDHIEVEKAGVVQRILFPKATRPTNEPSDPPGVIQTEKAAEGAGPYRQMVRSVRMSREDVEALVALAQLR